MPIESNLVLDQLRSVGKNGLKIYLEYLVKQRKSQEEQYHTELALLYVEKFKNLLQSDETKMKIETTSKCLKIVFFKCDIILLNIYLFTQ